MPIPTIDTATLARPAFIRRVAGSQAERLLAPHRLGGSQARSRRKRRSTEEHSFHSAPRSEQVRRRGDHTRHSPTDSAAAPSSQQPPHPKAVTTAQPLSTSGRPTRPFSTLPTAEEGQPGGDGERLRNNAVSHRRQVPATSPCEERIFLATAASAALNRMTGATTPPPAASPRTSRAAFDGTPGTAFLSLTNGTSTGLAQR